MVNKAMAIIAAALAIGMAVIFGIFGSTGGLLMPNVRPDHQTPAVTELEVTIENIDGVDRLLNKDKTPNGDFLSCLGCTLTLTITNNGKNTHTIIVSEVGASSGPIAPGQTGSISVIVNKYGSVTYQSQEHPDQIQGQIKILKIG